MPLNNWSFRRSLCPVPILSFLSVRNLLSIRKTDIAQKGFAYNYTDIKAEVKGNTLTIREGILDSNMLQDSSLP